MQKDCVHKFQDVKTAQGKLLRRWCFVCGEVEEIEEFRKLAKDLLDPEVYGHTVTGEIRNRARRCFGWPESEKNG